MASAIEGFETPYGMELLGTVHWAAAEEPSEVRSLDETLRAIHQWNARKRSVFDEDHVRQVYEHLKAEGWFDESIDGNEPQGRDV